MIKLHSIARQVTEASDMEEVFSAEITEAEGLCSDIADTNEITVLSRESWVKVCEETASVLPWLAHGSQLLVKGFEFLPTDVGRTLHIGDTVLEIMRETGPCDHLKSRAPVLYEALLMGWRGGVTCRVIQSGSIQTGDDINIAD